MIGVYFTGYFNNVYLERVRSSFDLTTGDRILQAIMEECQQAMTDGLSSAVDHIKIDQRGISNFKDWFHDIGILFHKSFRQTDPLEPLVLNRTAWLAIADAPTFWDSLEDTCRDLWLWARDQSN